MVERRTFSTEFKKEAVQLAKSNGFSQTGRDLDIHPSQLYKWRRRIEKNGRTAFPGKGNARDEELARTQRENARLREEVAIWRAISPR